MVTKVLVTGANGFLGRRIKKFHEKIGAFEFYWHNGLCDGNLSKSDVVTALPKCDIIVHLAAKTFVPASFEMPVQFYEDNILSTLYLLEKARKDNAKFIFLSSYVYGIPLELPISEAHPTNPLNPYSTSKHICEDICKSYSRDFGVSCIIFRPFNIYGPGQRKNFLIPLILSQINNEVVCLENATPRRDFIYVDDIVTAIICALKNDFNGFNIYNLGSGISYSVSEIVDIIQKMINYPLRVKYNNTKRENEILDTVANNLKFSNAYNWKPIVDIEQGISLILKSNDIDES